MRILGVLLVVFGLLALIYQGFTYTKRETVVDIGPGARDGRSQKDRAASADCRWARSYRRCGTARER